MDTRCTSTAMVVWYGTYEGCLWYLCGFLACFLLTKMVSTATLSKCVVWCMQVMYVCNLTFLIYCPYTQHIPIHPLPHYYLYFV